MTATKSLRATRRWLERSVIGLNLCPFAEASYRGDRVRFRVSEQRSRRGIAGGAARGIAGPARARIRGRCETTLLIHPWVLDGFRRVQRFPRGLRGGGRRPAIWKASCRSRAFIRSTSSPGPQPEDIENYTNRSPYPMLHLLREASVERALAAVADPDEIYRRNIRTLRALGLAGWQALWKD